MVIKMMYKTVWQSDSVGSWYEMSMRSSVLNSFVVVGHCKMMALSLGLSDCQFARRVTVIIVKLELNAKINL